MKKFGMFVALLCAALVFAIVGSAIADTVTYPGVPVAPGRQQAEGTVNVTASVNPKITLTVTTPDALQTVDFGNIDPGTAYNDSVDLSVNSNKAFDISSATAGDVAELGFSNDLADQAGVGKGAAIGFTDNYEVNAPYTTDPGAYAASVTYTVVQN